jgi:hypothetical protein
MTGKGIIDRLLKDAKQRLAHLIWINGTRRLALISLNTIQEKGGREGETPCPGES